MQEYIAYELTGTPACFSDLYRIVSNAFSAYAEPFSSLPPLLVSWLSSCSWPNSFTSLQNNVARFIPSPYRRSPHCVPLYSPHSLWTLVNTLSEHT